MNQATLMETIAQKTGLTKKQIEQVFDTFEATVIEQLRAKNSVNLTGFVKFSAKVRHKRMGVDPQKPTERIEIPEVVIPKFKSGKGLKDSLKGKR